MMGNSNMLNVTFGDVSESSDVVLGWSISMFVYRAGTKIEAYLTGTHVIKMFYRATASSAIHVLRKRE